MDPSKTDVLNISKIQTMITDVLLLESDNLTIAGAHCVMDSKGATMAHFAGITPSLMKKLMKIFQDSYPARIKGVVYINIPSFFQLVLDLVKQFMNEKLKKRVGKSTVHFLIFVSFHVFSTFSFTLSMSEHVIMLALFVTLAL